MPGHRFNPDKAANLLSDERKQRLPYGEIMEKLGIDPEDVIADLGAGNGFFAIPMARYLNNTVYAVDVEPRMMEALKERAEAERITNICYLQSDLASTAIDDHSVDKVLAAFVMHEMPSIEDTLDEIKRIVKPGGAMLFLEWALVETEKGPPLNERISSEDLAAIFEKKGLAVTTLSLNPANYAIYATIA